MKAIENYKKTVEYYNKVNYSNQMNFIWANNMGDISNIVTSSNSHEELIDKIDRTYMYSINFDPCLGEDSGMWKKDGDNPHIREKQIDWLLKRFEGSPRFCGKPFEDFQESQFIHQRNQVYRDGQRLSGNFLRTCSILQRIFNYVRVDNPSASIENVIELGGGTGHQARTFLLQGAKKYTIVDLPETLIFSFAHLSLCFPEKKLLWVTNEDELKLIDDYDVVFIPAFFADKLAGREYDLFINTASMGEMRNETILYYMNWIQNVIKVKYLFTLNRFLNTCDEGHKYFRVNENECSTSYDHKWKILNWELEPIYCRCPFIDTLHSRYVEIIAERSDNDNLVQRSNELLQDAKDEDWYRMRGIYNNGVMQARNNVLVNDMTMNGPLFKLWESIRFDQNRENVSVMLEYLDRITVKEPFEERFYYEKLLERLNNKIL